MFFVLIFIKLNSKAPESEEGEGGRGEGGEGEEEGERGRGGERERDGLDENWRRDSPKEFDFSSESRGKKMLNSNSRTHL